DRILPMYQEYQDLVHYIAISDADRHPSLRYEATIHHGIPIDDFPFQPKRGEDLLFFGRIHPDKGAAEAIEAARLSKRPLHMYGIVQDEHYHDMHVAPADDGVNVIYHGVAGGSERLNALGDARALLHLINFDEPFGLSVIEAMACGTPVIATNRGSMPELIEHGVTGFLVNTALEAVQAIERIDDIDRFAVRQSVIDRFSIDRMADNYLTVYHRILGTKP
ncbi:MAG: glycosyltransferase family 4 protein, partial [Rhodopirellula bahusiensis]